MAKCRHHGTRRLNIKKFEIYIPSMYSRNFIHVSKLLQPWVCDFSIINDLLDRVRPPIGKKKKSSVFQLNLKEKDYGPKTASCVTGQKK